MRLLLLSILITLSASVHASRVQLALFEEATKKTTYHALTPEDGRVETRSDAAGPSLAPINSYSIRNYKLEAASTGKVLMEATEILAQVQASGFDILVIREEYNSFSNPFRWIAAFAGHPIQVSKILWVVIQDGAVLHTVELKREPSSYRWTAQLSEPALPAKPQ